MANSTGEEAAGECIDDVEGAEIDEDEEKMKSSMGPSIPGQGSSAGLDSQIYTYLVPIDVNAHEEIMIVFSSAYTG